MLPPFFFQLAHLAAKSFVISSTSLPRYEIPCGCKFVMLEPTWMKLIRAGGAAFAARRHHGVEDNHAGRSLRQDSAYR
jgi:hypothetical protein